jgi:dipeptidyl aminopeptidase/acylaminoacyl peptidase
MGQLVQERDLRNTDLYKQVQEHFQKLFAGSGRIIDAVEPALSPDGKTVAFSGKYLNSLEEQPFYALCLYDISAGKVKQVGEESCSCRSPQWSPAGDQLAYLCDSAEKGHMQIHIYDVVTQKTTAAPKVDGIAEYFSWSPSGQRIIIGIAAAGADLAGAQGSGSHAAKNDDMPGWIPTVDTGDNESQRRSLWLLDVSCQKLVPIEFGKNVWESAFCSDDSILAVVSDETGEWAWYFADLVRFDIDTKELRTLHRVGSRQVGLPRATRSGSRLAFIEAICSDRMIIAGDVMLLESGKTEAVRIDSLSVDVMQIQWIDEHRLFFIGLQNLDTVAGEYDVRTRKSRELWRSSETCGLYQTDAFASDTGIVLVLQSFTRYPELVVIKDGAIAKAHSFSHPGTQYAQGIGGKIEQINWTGRDGLSCDGLLITPREAGPNPLVVRVHGGPIGAFRNFWMMRDPVNLLLLKQGYAIFFPNPRGSSGKGQAFAEKVVGDMCGEDTYDILKGVEKLVQDGVADDKRVGVTGGSYGGLMTCWLVTQTTRFAAAIAHAPVTDWYSQHYTSNIGFWDQWFLGGPPPTNPEYAKRSPVLFAAAVKTPTMITAGMKDRCTPAGQAIEFHNALIEAKAPSQLVLYPEEGHHLHRLEAQIDNATRVVAWFTQHMPA